MPTSFPSSGHAPWTMASISYAGWIPNVLGHLSFSLVGLKGHWANSNSLNHALNGDGSRSIAVRKDRIAQDYPFFDWIVRIIKPAAVQSYLMVASTHQAKIPFVNDNSGLNDPKVRIFQDEQGLLCGTVYITPRNRNKETANLRKNALKEIDALLSGKKPADNDICSQASAIINRDTDGGFPSIPYRFAIFRTGEVRIWMEDDQIVDEWVSHEKARLVLEETFPKQVYYFLKDTLHTHYHHEPDSDQLLPLTRLETNPSLNEQVERENEVSWRRETLWGLARVVSSYRRSNRIKNLRRAQGVLAYADAFQATVAKVYRPSDLSENPRFDGNLTTYDFGHTKQSVAALEGLRQWWNVGSIQILAGLTALMLGAFTIWSSALRLRVAKCSAEAADSDEPVCSSAVAARSELVLEWIVDHPLVFSGVLFTGAALYYQSVVRDLDYGPLLRRYSRFFSAAARALGSTVGRSMGSALGGFSITIFTLLLTAAVLFAIFAGLGLIMQST